MQEFLKTDTINSSFIPITGYRTLIVFESLLEGPKTIDELKEILYKNKYIRLKLSDDTIRFYINSLRKVGCNISKALKSTHKKFVLTKHPFIFALNKEELNVFKKVAKIIRDSENLSNLAAFESFVLKVISMIDDENSINYLYGLLIINRLDKNLYNRLTEACEHNKTIIMRYCSAGYGEQIIEFYCEKIIVKSGKIYLSGYNKKFKNHSTLLISRIIDIKNVKNEKPLISDIDKSVICEISDKNYIPSNDEEILEICDNKIVVRMFNEDEFRTIQKILSMANECVVLQPEYFKKNLKEKIKKMRTLYG